MQYFFFYWIFMEPGVTTGSLWLPWSIHLLAHCHLFFLVERESLNSIYLNLLPISIMPINTFRRMWETCEHPAQTEKEAKSSLLYFPRVKNTALEMIRGSIHNSLQLVLILYPLDKRSTFHQCYTSSVRFTEIVQHKFKIGKHCYSLNMEHVNRYIHTSENVNKESHNSLNKTKLLT